MTASYTKHVSTETLLKFYYADDPELSDNLKFVYVASISNAECRMIYGSQISDNMVCVQGNYNQGTCTVN